MTKIVLFICVGNSGRSQIAEAFFNKLSKTGKAISAGTMPDDRIHPYTVQVMKEAGIDVSQQKPKPLTPEMIDKADKIKKVRDARDQIKEKVKKLIRQIE